MGTRNLTVVKDFDGVIKVAQYGQWDGYPEYTGKIVLDFLREPTAIADLTIGLLNCRWLTNDELDVIYKDYTDDDGYMDEDQSNKFKIDYPSLTRDTGVMIVPYIASNTVSTQDIPLVNEYEFKDDDLFCEGYYELDLQSNKFITKYNGIEVEYDLNALPSNDDYLRAFGVVVEAIPQA